MNTFRMGDRTLELLAAQSSLNGTYNHLCRSPLSGRMLRFRLEVERNSETITFTLDLRGGRHTITLPGGDERIHLHLAAAIEAIANGSAISEDSTLSIDPIQPVTAEPLLTLEHRRLLVDLINEGGAIRFDLGLELPIDIAVHRTASREGITAILCIGDGYPLTTCFTVYGDGNQAMERLVKSILHLAATTTSAMQAA